MDEHRFDDIARAASAIGSRRAALRAIAGGILAAVLPAAAAGKKGRHGHDRADARRPRQGPSRPRCEKGEILCGGACLGPCENGQRRDRRTCECRCTGRPCRDGKVFDPITCDCVCPDGMKECDGSCVGADRCCAGERQCSSGGCVPAGACCHDERQCANGRCVPEVGTDCCPGERICDNRFCIPGDQCCFVTERDCPDGTCIPKDACCLGQRRCADGTCVADDACCPGQRQCPSGGCVAADACCPGYEDACPVAPSGCCNPLLGEVCADDGCCQVIAGDRDVCGGKCVDLTSDNANCGACGNRCGSCETCRDGACVGPDRNPPACQTCSNGQIVSGVSGGDRCCGAGTECCGGGCCAVGKCRAGSNGVPCCLKVIDNRQYCVVL
jgi:hypothetical protein